MAKVLASTLSVEELRELIEQTEREIEALDCKRRALENMRCQKRNPELDFGVLDFYVNL